MVRIRLELRLDLVSGWLVVLHTYFSSIDCHCIDIQILTCCALHIFIIGNRSSITEWVK